MTTTTTTTILLINSIATIRRLLYKVMNQLIIATWQFCIPSYNKFIKLN